MAADSPWIKWWTDDFLMGVVDLAADEIGVYAVLLNLMASRGGPIPDDRRWLARRCGTGTRRFNQIIDRLTELGKLQHREGLIGNRRMIEELEVRTSKSAQARSAAMQRWHADQNELPLEAGLTRAHADPRAHESQKPKIISRKNEVKNVLFSSGKRQKSRTSPKNADADASPLAGARVRGSEDSERNTQPNPTHRLAPSARAREAADPLDESLGLGESTPVLTAASAALLDPVSLDTDRSGGPTRGDTKSLYDAVCETAGFMPTQEAAIDRAMRQVDKWRKAGIDFDEVVLPVIRAAVLASDEPTRVLGRFNPTVQLEHAKRKAAVAKGEPYTPPEGPKLSPPDEDPALFPLRTDLLKALGERSYCLTLNRVRLEDGGTCNGDKHPLRVAGPAYLLEPLRQGPIAKLIRKLARDYGFTDVWCV